MGADYDQAFYDTIRPGVIASAEVLVPLIIDRYIGMVRPARIIDVGCGEGWWAYEFADHGCDVIGLDGDYVNTGPLGDRLHHHDLNDRLPTDLGTFDLAVSLEVAEHLPLARAASFVRELCALAPAVAFSAAIPHQTGAGHINLQWQSWWAALFAAEGFADANGTLRWAVWDDERVEPWYRQNLVVYLSGEALGRDDGSLDVVHPIIHCWGRT